MIEGNLRSEGIVEVSFGILILLSLFQTVLD